MSSSTTSFPLSSSSIHYPSASITSSPRSPSHSASSNPHSLPGSSPLLPSLIEAPRRATVIPGPESSTSQFISKKRRFNGLDSADSSPASVNPHVTLYLHGTTTFQSILRAIDNAQVEVLYEAYSFNLDDIGTQVFDHLVRAAERGVYVVLVYDVFGSNGVEMEQFQALIRAGGRVVEFNPVLKPWRWQRSPFFRNHRKNAIIDGVIGFTGGMNTTDEYVSGNDLHGTSFKDFHTRIIGPSVLGMRDVFRDTLSECGTSFPLAELPSNTQLIDMVLNADLYRPFFQSSAIARQITASDWTDDSWFGEFIKTGWKSMVARGKGLLASIEELDRRSDDLSGRQELKESRRLRWGSANPLGSRNPDGVVDLESNESPASGGVLSGLITSYNQKLFHPASRTRVDESSSTIQLNGEQNTSETELHRVFTQAVKFGQKKQQQQQQQHSQPPKPDTETTPTASQQFQKAFSNATQPPSVASLPTPSRIHSQSSTLSSQPSPSSDPISKLKEVPTNPLSSKQQPSTPAALLTTPSDMHEASVIVENMIRQKQHSPSPQPSPSESPAEQSPAAEESPPAEQAPLPSDQPVNETPPQLPVVRSGALRRRSQQLFSRLLNRSTWFDVLARPDVLQAARQVNASASTANQQPPSSFSTSSFLSSQRGVATSLRFSRAFRRLRTRLHRFRHVITHPASHTKRTFLALHRRYTRLRQSYSKLQKLKKMHRHQLAENAAAAAAVAANNTSPSRSRSNRGNIHPSTELEQHLTSPPKDLQQARQVFWKALSCAFNDTNLHQQQDKPTQRHFNALYDEYSGIAQYIGAHAKLTKAKFSHLKTITTPQNVTSSSSHLLHTDNDDHSNDNNDDTLHDRDVSHVDPRIDEIELNYATINSMSKMLSPDTHHTDHESIGWSAVQPSYHHIFPLPSYSFIPSPSVHNSRIDLSNVSLQLLSDGLRLLRSSRGLYVEQLRETLTDFYDRVKHLRDESIFHHYIMTLRQSITSSQTLIYGNHPSVSLDQLWEQYSRPELFIAGTHVVTPTTTPSSHSNEPSSSSSPPHAPSSTTPLLSSPSVQTLERLAYGKHQQFKSQFIDNCRPITAQSLHTYIQNTYQRVSLPDKDNNPDLAAHFTNIPAHVLASNVWTNTTKIQNYYVRAIRSATESIYITNPYVLPPRWLKNELLQAADRGVKVHLLLSGPGANDVPHVRLASLHAYQQYLDHNILIYEYSRRTLHAKVMVVDRTHASVGSFNLDPYSINVNLETTMVFPHDHKVAQALIDSTNNEIQDPTTRFISRETVQQWPKVWRWWVALAFLISRIVYTTIRIRPIQMLLKIKRFFVGQETPSLTQHIAKSIRNHSANYNNNRVAGQNASVNRVYDARGSLHPAKSNIPPTSMTNHQNSLTPPKISFLQWLSFWVLPQDNQNQPAPTSQQQQQKQKQQSSSDDQTEIMDVLVRQLKPKSSSNSTPPQGGLPTANLIKKQQHEQNIKLHHADPGQSLFREGLQHFWRRSPPTTSHLLRLKYTLIPAPDASLEYGRPPFALTQKPSPKVVLLRPGVVPSFSKQQSIYQQQQHQLSIRTAAALLAGRLPFSRHFSSYQHQPTLLSTKAAIDALFDSSNHTKNQPSSNNINLTSPPSLIPSSSSPSPPPPLAASAPKSHSSPILSTQSRSYSSASKRQMSFLANRHRPKPHMAKPIRRSRSITRAPRSITSPSSDRHRRRP